jgi:predicted lipoprotein with Yx(FWY)xxD motif
MSMRIAVSRTLHSVGTAAVLLAVVACGSDSDPDPAPAPDPGGTPPAAADGALVSTQEVENVGTVLVDAAGMALYTTDAETDGTVRCVDACTNFWPPLIGTADQLPASVEGISGEFGVVTRPDGADQVTLDGLPLYTFTDDRQPGTVLGDGLADEFGGTRHVWHVVLAGDAAGGGGTSDDGGATEDSGGGSDY